MIVFNSIFRPLPKIKMFFWKTYSESPFYGYFRNGITIKFSYIYDGDISCHSGCKNHDICFIQ